MPLRVPLAPEVARAARDWRQTVDALDVAVVVVGEDGRVGRLNLAARDLAGGSFQDLVGRPASELAEGEPWSTAAALARRALETGCDQVARCAPAERKRVWDVAARTAGGPGGEGRSVVLVLRDMTETVALQEALRRSELSTALGTLVAGVAHEVRNPLFAISATVDAFEERFRRDPGLHRYSGILREQIRRLSSLMSELIELGRPPNLDLSLSSPATLIAEAVSICAPRAAEARVRVIAERLPPVADSMLDRERIIHALANVLENAIEHSPPGALVRIFARPAGPQASDGLVFRVEDEGSGVSEEDRMRIFEPFFSRRPGAAGLGLAIARRIVEEHGGSIEVEKASRGGAVFSVWIPENPGPPAAPVTGGSSA